MGKIRKYLSAILVTTLILSGSSIPTNAKTTTSNANINSKISTTSDLTKYVESKIKEFSSTIKECTWNSSSKIGNITPLYNLDGNINGYIYYIKTNGKDTGFIQIDCSTSKNIVSSFSFTGKHALNSMLDAYKKNHKKSTYPETDKVIYLGNYNYLVKNGIPSNKKYYNLNSQSDVYQTDETLKNDYIKNVKRKESNSNSTETSLIAPMMTASVAATTTTKYVTNANYNILVDMGDFAGKYVGSSFVDNHCSPTAGTNIIKYWAFKRGVIDLYNESDWWVFSSLYVNMKTNTYHNGVFLPGSIADDIYSGLWNYGANTRGITPSGRDWLQGIYVYYGKARSIIDANVPFIIDVFNYGCSLKFHSMTCFGYYENPGTYTSSNYLIINTDWNRDWTYEYYDNLNVMDFIYSRWN